MLKSAAPQNNGRNYAITELCWIGKLHVSEPGGANYSKWFPKITQSAILHTAGRRGSSGGDAAAALRGVRELLHPAGSTGLALAPVGTAPSNTQHLEQLNPAPRGHCC